MKRLWSAAVVAVVTATSLGAGTVTAGASTSPVPVAKGLDNPRQMAFSPNGNLYVALAGRGRLHAKHPGGCANDPEGGTACVGDTGGIERVLSPGSAAAGAGRQVQYGLLSIADKGSGQDDPPGTAAVGLDAISFAPNGTEWGIITIAPPSGLKGEPTWVKNESGRLVQIRNSTVYPMANVGAFSLKHPTKGHAVDSDPYGVLALNDRVFIADAAADTILEWTKSKGLRIIHAFPHRNGDGSDGSFDTVPTSLATDGTHLFVGTLASFIPGKAKVYELSFSGRVIKTFNNLSQVTSVAVDAGGNVYVTEIFGGKQGPFDSQGNPNGLVIELHKDGKRTSKHVPLPGGVAVRNGHLFVSVWTVMAGRGQVWRLR